jgi:t-SNARE complex subunit (syntaxin)
MLLNHVRGPKFFNDIKTYNGTEYPTFKEAALVTGLLHNNAEYDAFMQEAILSARAIQIKRFVVALILLVILQCTMPPIRPVEVS